MIRIEKPLLCPNCKAPMHQTRATPRGEVLAERTYECRVCKMVVVEPAQPPIQE